MRKSGLTVELGVAGPLLHHKQMMPQFGHAMTYRFNMKSLNVGLTIFVIGLAKKVLLADQFALFANPVFDAVGKGGEAKLIEAWIGALAYTFQLYFDFSGYSDMAIGLSRMFNVKLPLNFDSPYKSRNIIQFWRRWHMTLSTFLRDYLYVPLGGSRKGVPRRYANLMTTMLLGGLWHGASWTFVMWGGLHGLYLVINHGWRRLTRSDGTASELRGIAGIGLTFIAVVIAWVLFRANDLDAALRMWSGMFGVNGISMPKRLEPELSILFGHTVAFIGVTPLTGIAANEAVLAIAVGLGAVWLLPNTQQVAAIFLETHDPEVRISRFFTWKPTSNHSIHVGIIIGILFSTSLGLINRFSPFLYFQF